MTTARLPGIPTAEEEKRTNWKIDTETSFARLTLTPIVAISDEGTRYYVSIDKALKINPYPNPYAFGGMWGCGRYKPEEEAGAVQQFHDYISKWKALGLHKIEVIHNPQETHRVPTEKQRQEALAKYTNGSVNKKLPKPNSQQIRLIA